MMNCRIFAPSSNRSILIAAILFWENLFVGPRSSRVSLGVAAAAAATGVASTAEAAAKTGNATRDFDEWKSSLMTTAAGENNADDDGGGNNNKNNDDGLGFSGAYDDESAMAWSRVWKSLNAKAPTENQVGKNRLKMDDLRVISEVGGIMPIRGVCVRES